MAENPAQMYGTPAVPIRCAACPMMKIIGRARYTDNNDHLSRPRGSCYCRHPEAEAAFRLICPGSGRASCFIAFTRGGTDGPDIKTAPRWCPRKIASEPRRISREDASTIVESRHPYGLFFLKDAASMSGLTTVTATPGQRSFPRNANVWNGLQTLPTKFKEERWRAHVSMCALPTTDAPASAVILAVCRRVTDS